MRTSTTATCCGTSATPPSSSATTTAQQHFYSCALSRAREAGAVTAVIYCLQRLCFGHWPRGDHVALRVSAEEALALGTSIGQPALTALADRLAHPARRTQQDRDDYDDLLRAA